MIVYSISRMKGLTLFVALLGVISVKSKTFPECDILLDGASIPSIYTINIDDYQIGLILDLTTVDVDTAKTNEEAMPYSKYFDVNFDVAATDTMKLSLSAKYEDMEQNEPSKTEVTTLSLQIDITCQGVGLNLFIDAVVKDNNNQITEMPIGPILYNIPLPLPANMPLYLFSDTPDENKLIARDADISNDIITFEIVPSNIFKITGKKDERDSLGKTYLATITAIQPITKLEVNSFVVVAKDKDAISSAPIIISISVDDESSIPASPSFVKDYYEGTYIISETSHSLQLDTLLLKNPAAHEILVKLNQKVGDFFSAVYDEAKAEITISKHTDLTQDILTANDFLILLVEAWYSDFDVASTSVSVLITLPSKGEQTFDKALYTATYDETIPAVDLSVPIVVAVPDLTLGFVETENSEYFGAMYNTQNPLEIDITLPLGPLPQYVIEKQEVISLILTAKTADIDYGRTVILIDLPAIECPAKPTVFSKTLYNGEYVAVGNPHTIALEKIVVTSADPLTVHIEPNDYPEYFNINDDDPTNIQVNLIADLTEAILKDNEIISLILVARKAADNNIVGSSVVVINLPPGECSAPIEYAFSKPLYQGKYEVLAGQATLSTELIEAGAAITETLLVDIIDSDFKSYFEATILEPPKVEITVKIDIPQEIIDEHKFITLVLGAKGATNREDYGQTGLVIELPSEPKETMENVFGQTLYEGTYENEKLTFKDVITASSNDVLDIKFEKSGPEFENYFRINFDTPPNVEIDVIPTGIPQDVIDDNDFITLILSAKSIDGVTDYGKTGLVINLPEKECAVEPSDDIFDNVVYEGKYIVPKESGVHTIEMDKITVITDDVVVVTLAGDYQVNFDATLNGKEVTLSIKKELTEDVWIKNSYISILLQGTSGTLTGAARILLELPEPECELPNPGDESITFENIYKSLPPTHSGLIVTLKAVFDPTEAHTFTIDNKLSWVELADNGVDLITVPLSDLNPGTYTLTATVTGNDSGKTKNALVTLYVQSGSQGKTKHSMIVLKIKEELSRTDILELPDDTDDQGVVYQYVIQQQDPEDPPMFSIEDYPENRRFLTSVKIDRENEIFKKMRVPQVVLRISLEPKSATKVNSILATNPLFKYILKHENREDDEFKQCLMLPEIIPRADNIVYVPIIIEDTNDNRPVFNPPSIVVGYPAEDIVIDINPQYLMKVEATDADEGVNAIIKYSSTSTSIKINPDTGIVYPTEALYNDAQKATFTIGATDSVNVADPELSVNVLILDKDHVSVLGFPNLFLEDLDEKLIELSEKANLDIRSLSARSLPLGDTSKVREDSGLLVKAIVYALDGNAALTHEALKEKLGADVSVIEYTPGTLNPDPGTTDEPEECDDTGLIAGISVLAVALVVCIVGFIVFYFKRRNNNASLDLEQLAEPKTSFKKSDAISNGFNNDLVLKDVATRRPTQYPMEGPVLPIEFGSSSSSSSSSEDEKDFDEERDRRKSVTFNEKMQHFDITTKENETDSIKADDSENKET